VAAGVSPGPGFLRLSVDWLKIRPNSKKCVVATALVLPLLILIDLAGDAEPQAPPSIDFPVPRPYRISLDVDLVVLNVAVRDRNGRFASDLREPDFEIYEDGVRQSVQLFKHEDIPVTVGLVIDHSGSMRPKLADVIAAAGTFVQASSPEDEMFVINFNEKVTIGLPDAILLTNRSDELTRAISNSPSTGKTALYDAIVKARERLQTGGRDKKVLIVISDGGDNASAHSLAEVLKMAEQSSALVYTIGIFDEEDADRNPDVLRRLARVTGGEAFFPGKLNGVVAICERIARDIRHQYTIGYVSNNAANPGAYRSIRVVARGTGNSKLFVRTRSGYIASGESRLVKREGAK
jgi:Ca-activated chloride channel homolog